ncbi:MAG: helix-turn-helix transcriptional regulator, partial [Flavobacterium sp.]|nr:helix-turn-helix transcriptional regulator [Flavobacterium sp.]
VHYFESNLFSEKSKIQLSANLISFLIEGKKELFHNNQSQIISDSEFVLAKSGNCLMTETLSVNKKYASLLFFFDDAFIIDFQKKYFDIIKLKNVKSENIIPFSVIKYDKFIRDFVSAVCLLLQSEASVSASLLKLKLEEILLYLVQKYDGSIVNFFTKSNKIKQNTKLQNIVENNIFSKLSLEELAFLCHMSLSTFKREFIKIYQLSPSRWFQDKRLEKSAQLLTQEKERPSDIYLTVGYESLSSFTQSFKQKFGKTPKKYQLEYF